MSELLLLNPRRRRRRKMTAKQAKYFSPRRRRRRSARRRVRRNPYPITLAANPRRRRRRARRNPILNPRRRYRRNPAFRLPSAKGIMGQVTDAGMGAVGATAVDILMGFVAPRLPAALLTPNVYPIVKGGVAIGFGALGQSFGFGRQAAEMAKGSLICTLRDVIRGFLPATLTLGFINSGYVPGRSRMGAYVAGMGNVRTPLMGVKTPLLMGMGQSEAVSTAMEREAALYGPGYISGGMRGFGAYTQ